LRYQLRLDKGFEVGVADYALSIKKTGAWRHVRQPQLSVFIHLYQKSQTKSVATHRLLDAKQLNLIQFPDICPSITLRLMEKTRKRVIGHTPNIPGKNTNNRTRG